MTGGKRGANMEPSVAVIEEVEAACGGGGNEDVGGRGKPRALRPVDARVTGGAFPLGVYGAGRRELELAVGSEDAEPPDAVVGFERVSEQQEE